MIYILYPYFLYACFVAIFLPMHIVKLCSGIQLIDKNLIFSNLAFKFCLKESEKHLI